MILTNIRTPYYEIWGLYDFTITKQVTLVRGLAQLFLVEMVFLNYQQTIYLYNFKKQKKHILAVSFC